MLKFLFTSLLLAVAACNSTSQLDRDFAACIILVKGSAKCTVETNPPTLATPVVIPK